VHFVVICAVCTALWMLFPKGFKYVVGTFMGVCGGGFFWGFTSFIVCGIIAGCVLAVRG